MTSISFGPDIVVNSMSVPSATVIEAEISIAATAALGARGVTVTNAAPGGGSVTIEQMAQDRATHNDRGAHDAYSKCGVASFGKGAER